MNDDEHHYLVIGGGQMADHWFAYLGMQNFSCSRWARSTHDVATLVSLLDTADHVFLAISDDSLESFHDEHLKDYHNPVYHFSGCHVSGKMYSCHPLMTFGKALYEPDIYRGMTLVLESEHLQSAGLFNRFPNTIVSIPAASKPLYHALCVMSCNFPQIIWSQTLAQFEELGIAADSVQPLLLTTLRNSIKNPRGSITGPLARNDKSTMKKNIQSLKSDSEKELYRSFMKLMDCQGT
ncbi:Rossmann-like and DUF2520 domain-containing protein [Granulosicoccus antarcticus]|uniref:DUF2520 domain-containing protein n=1 Tax=Granulosicoccus antarcticus IMCC3135 TaxID=1192854 RepID=A0A2Z2NIT3_9GAMM|nr:Rossmann-like and DUF2520 domain-containing protein [Granulosicoccus antarcticus]ASJ71262.1 hypothetical protein IMCC3135_05750 [Granulosicoccus antarcticus IMCC3135]